MLPITPALPYLQGDAALLGGEQSFTLSQSPLQGGFFWLFYNGSLQIPVLDFSLSQRTVNLNFQTRPGDNCYAIYQAVTSS